MKILLFYFSGTGNTKWVAERFQDALAENGASVDLRAITYDYRRALDSISLGEYVKIGVAHPIYGAGLPPIMEKFYAGLESRLEKPTSGFIIATFGYVNGLGYFEENKQFYNLRVRQYINIHMPNNVTSPRLKSAIPGAKESARMRKTALKNIRRAARAIIGGKRRITGIAPYLIAGKIIRERSRSAVKSHYKELSVDAARCSQCLDCVDNCPMQAITNINGAFSFSFDCTACMRCYNSCPQNAILIGGAYADPREYPRYTFHS